MAGKPAIGLYGWTELVDTCLIVDLACAPQYTTDDAQLYEVSDLLIYVGNPGCSLPTAYQLSGLARGACWLRYELNYHSV